MIKLFVSDFDGTLVPEDERRRHGLKQADIEAIHYLAGRGCKFVIATGRHPNFIRKIIGGSIPAYDLVCFCGNIIIGQGYYKTACFSKDTVRAVYQFVKKDAELDFYLCTTDNNYIFSRKDSYIYSAKSTQLMKAENIYDIDGIIDTDIDSLVEDREQEYDICRMVIRAENICKLQNLYHKFPAVFPDMDLIKTGPLQFEIMQQGVNKTSAIISLAEHYSIKPDEIAVVGDSDNDIDMLKEFKLSYAMDTADPHVQSVAGHVTASVGRAIQDALNHA